MPEVRGRARTRHILPCISWASHCILDTYASKLTIPERLQKKGLVGIELEVKAGEADLLCRRNEIEAKILSKGLPRAACDGAGGVLVLEGESGEKRFSLLQEIDLASGL